MNITKNRNIWFSISGAALVLSLVLIFTLQLNLGLDFTGGARWDMSFKQETTLDSVKRFFDNRVELNQAVKIQTSDENTFLVTIQDLPDDEITKITNDLSALVGEFETKSYRKVDANIGGSFKKKAFIAIITALIGMIFFVAYAFRKVPQSINPWRFGGVAILALIHDILLVLGIFTVLGFLLQTELDLPFLTALLATLGFSINDTIVILDRVRENIRTQKSTENFEDTVEKSVQQTITRSINTSLSTLFPLFGLLFFGAASIHYFVLALILGILIGTYSSIFIAAPLLVSWKNWSDARE